MRRRVYVYTLTKDQTRGRTCIYRWIAKSEIHFSEYLVAHPDSRHVVVVIVVVKGCYQRLLRRASYFGGISDNRSLRRGISFGISSEVPSEARPSPFPLPLILNPFSLIPLPSTFHNPVKQDLREAGKRKPTINRHRVVNAGYIKTTILFSHSARLNRGVILLTFGDIEREEGALREKVLLIQPNINVRILMSGFVTRTNDLLLLIY